MELYTLYHHEYSICSIMVRYTLAVAGEPRQGVPSMQVEERRVDILNGEQLDEHYLTEINPKGQVPVLASAALEKPIADSLDITFWLAERYPALMPEAHEEEARDLLKALHAMNYFSLSFPERPYVAHGFVKAVNDLLHSESSSERYKDALRYKLSIVTTGKVEGIRPHSVRENEGKASALLSRFESLLSPEGSWLWGLERPSALDAHLVIFVARLRDVGRGSLVPDRLKEYADRAFLTTQLKVVMAGRTTMVPR